MLLLQMYVNGEDPGGPGWQTANKKGKLNFYLWNYVNQRIGHFLGY